jgi:DNA-directed RNA polymerase specialized sigma24 family protein
VFNWCDKHYGYMGGQWLSKVAERHKEWIKIVNSFGEYDLAEDIVQESYIILYKYANEEKIIKDDIVSRGYMFFTLRTTWLQYLNTKNKIQKVRLDDDENYIQIEDYSEMDEQIGYNHLSLKINKHIEQWRWYDKTLFKLYSDTDMSIRKISKETNISWVSIFNTLKKCKNELKELFKEDYEDFKNEDYDKI